MGVSQEVGRAGAFAGLVASLLVPNNAWAQDLKSPSDGPQLPPVMSRVDVTNGEHYSVSDVSWPLSQTFDVNNYGVKATLAGGKAIFVPFTRNADGKLNIEVPEGSFQVKVITPNNAVVTLERVTSWADGVMPLVPVTTNPIQLTMVTNNPAGFTDVAVLQVKGPGVLEQATSVTGPWTPTDALDPNFKGNVTFIGISGLSSPLFFRLVEGTTVPSNGPTLSIALDGQHKPVLTVVTPDAGHNLLVTENIGGAWATTDLALFKGTNSFPLDDTAGKRFYKTKKE